jgi:predicted DsbA family dithiol-disulfide isomerase
MLQQSRFGDTGVRVVVGMGRGGDSQRMADRIAQNIALDDEELLARKLGISSVPAFIVLDAEGSKLVDGREGQEWAAEKFKL